MFHITPGRADFKEQILQTSGPDGTRRKIHAVARLEFQDGTRKEPTQDYHGSGRPHLHVLLFFDDDAWPSLQLEKHVSATLPPKGDQLRGYVLGSQIDQQGRGKWPVHAGASGWDPEARRLRLEHSAEDSKNGLRAYFTEIMDVLKSHQDLQVARDDQGVLRAYVAKYISKFSDSAQNDWLNDQAEANSIAATVLTRYHPCEPEMILQLFGGRFRQWSMTTHSRGRRHFIVPVPDQERLPRVVDQYLAAPWARGQLPLLDFLRKTTAKGEISGWLRRLHRDSGTAASLESFALDHVMQGEKVVAASTTASTASG
jgi:hypothetical protein